MLIVSALKVGWNLFWRESWWIGNSNPLLSSISRILIVPLTIINSSLQENRRLSYHRRHFRRNIRIYHSFGYDVGRIQLEIELQMVGLLKDSDILSENVISFCIRCLGTEYPSERCQEEVVTEQPLYEHRRWPEVYSLSTETISMKSVPTTKEWIFGAVKIWKCHFG